MIPYEVDPSLHPVQPAPEQLDDGFSPPGVAQDDKPPVPPGALTVNHASLLVALQLAAADDAVTSTPWMPPPGAGFHDGRLTLNGDAAAPACVTGTAIPAMVAVACRGGWPGFGVAFSAMKPSPVPPGALTVSHDASLEADHEPDC